MSPHQKSFPWLSQVATNPSLIITLSCWILQQQLLLPDIILFIHVLPCLLCSGGKPRSRWQSRRMSAQLLLQELQNYNSLLNNCRQENVGSHQKKIPHIQGQRRSPQKTVGGEKSHLESSPIPTRDAWRAQTNLVCTRTQGPHKD